MPYAILHADGDFKVVNTASGKVHARHTTKEKAEAQVRLLRGVEHGMVPRRKIGTDHMGTTQKPVPADETTPAPIPRRPYA